MKALMYNELSPRERKEMRELYVIEQKGKCFWCQYDIHKKPPEGITSWKVNLDLFPRGFMNNPIHLQHSHTTGLTEGAVHAHCNAVAWQYCNR